MTKSKSEEALDLVPRVMAPMGTALTAAIRKAADDGFEELENVQPVVYCEAQHPDGGGVFLFVLSVHFVPTGAETAAAPVPRKYDA